MSNGYAFQFAGTDSVIDELAAFIKSELECCDFFTFQLKVSGDASIVWLELEGSPEAKSFIKSEMGLTSQKGSQ